MPYTCIYRVESSYGVIETYGEVTDIDELKAYLREILSIARREQLENVIVDSTNLSYNLREKTFTQFIHLVSRDFFDAIKYNFYTIGKSKDTSTESFKTEFAKLCQLAGLGFYKANSIDEAVSMLNIHKDG